MRPLFYKGSGHLGNTIKLTLPKLGIQRHIRRLQGEHLFLPGTRAGWVFTRIFLAYFGQFPWHGVPAVPVELVLLPNGFSVNIYEMSSWARGTVVPLSMILAHRPYIPIPQECGVAELWKDTPENTDLAFPRTSHGVSWENFFLAFDHFLKFLGKSPINPLRRRALRKAELGARSPRCEWRLGRHPTCDGEFRYGPAYARLSSSPSSDDQGDSSD